MAANYALPAFRTPENWWRDESIFAGLDNQFDGKRRLCYKFIQVAKGSFLEQARH
jgi:hypothetical protein